MSLRYKHNSIKFKTDSEPETDLGEQALAGREDLSRDELQKETLESG